MTVNGFNEKMNSEINARLYSPEWDFNIASRVINKRNHQIKRNFYALSSLSALATAAVIVFAVFINTPATKMNDVELFISRQVEETHRTVFKEGYSRNLLTVSYSEDASDPFDNIIYNAISAR
jgi:hypothetical protein